MNQNEKRRVTSILLIALIVLGIVYINWMKEYGGSVDDVALSTATTTISGVEDVSENQTVSQDEINTGDTVDVGDVQQQVEAVKETVSFGQQYTNQALGFSITVPGGWNIDTQSQPGKYTVRFEGENNEFMNIWVHEVTIDLNTDRQGLINGYPVYIAANPTCPEGNGLCDVAAMRIPYQNVAVPGGGEWSVRVVEIIYGQTFGGNLSAPEMMDTQVFENSIKTFLFL